jgi:hypothetical protein
MGMVDDGVRISGDALVRATPQRNAGIEWPLPVHARLDELLDLATTAGENTSRKEIVAALVAGCTDDPDELSRLIRRFRTMRVAELITPGSDENVVVLAKHPPGRRKLGGAVG